MHDYFFDSSRLYGQLGEREMFASQRGIIKIAFKIGSVNFMKSNFWNFIPLLSFF